jgi:dTDP-glucose 4,6-dehydratase
MAELRKRHGADNVHGVDLYHDPHENVHRANVANFRQLERVFFGVKPDMVIHLAAEFGRHNGRDFYEECWNSNCVGMRNILELCYTFGAELIFSSSSEIYGDNAPPCLYEGDTEKMPVWPANDYAISKWANEMQIRNAIKERQQRIMTLRFFLVYGPGEEYSEYRSVVSIFCYRLLSGLPINVHQHCHRAFLYVDDFIETLAGAPMNFNTGEVINIANPEIRSVEELAEIVREATGASRDLLHFTEKDKMNVQHKRPDVTLAARLLGHTCRVSLEEGVLRTLDWMREKYDLPAFEVEYIPPEKNGAFQPLAPNPEVRFKDARVQEAYDKAHPKEDS